MAEGADAERPHLTEADCVCVKRPPPHIWRHQPDCPIQVRLESSTWECGCPILSHASWEVDACRYLASHPNPTHPS